MNLCNLSQSRSYKTNTLPKIFFSATSIQGRKLFAEIRYANFGLLRIRSIQIRSTNA